MFILTVQKCSTWLSMCVYVCMRVHHVCEKFTGIQTLVVSIFRFIVDRHLTPSVHLHLFQEWIGNMLSNRTKYSRISKNTASIFYFSILIILIFRLYYTKVLLILTWASTEIVQNIYTCKYILRNPGSVRIIRL